MLSARAPVVAAIKKAPAYRPLTSSGMPGHSSAAARAAAACAAVVLILVIVKALFVANSPPPYAQTPPTSRKPDISLVPPGSAAEALPKALLRIRARGAYLDDFAKRTPMWNVLTLSPHWEFFIFSRLGPASDDVCANASPSVKMVVSPFDLSSNVLHIANNILVAAYSNQSFVLVSASGRRFPNASTSVWQRPTALSALFEEHFAFAQEGDSMCSSFRASCQGRVRCIGAVAPQAMPSNALKHVDAHVVDALKTHLVREMLRIRPALKLLVDGTCALVGCPDERLDEGLTVALHVIHAQQHAGKPVKNVPLSIYVTAAMRKVKSRAVRKVFIVVRPCALISRD